MFKAALHLHLTLHRASRILISTISATAAMMIAARAAIGMYWKSGVRTATARMTILAARTWWRTHSTQVSPHQNRPPLARQQWRLATKSLHLGGRRPKNTQMEWRCEALPTSDQASCWSSYTTLSVDCRPARSPRHNSEFFQNNHEHRQKARGAKLTKTSQSHSSMDWDKRIA